LWLEAAVFDLKHNCFHTIASEAKQSSFLVFAAWIASSQALLAMTSMEWCRSRVPI